MSPADTFGSSWFRRLRWPAMSPRLHAHFSTDRGREGGPRELSSPLPQLLRAMRRQVAFAVALVIVLHVLEQILSGPAQWLHDQLRSVAWLREIAAGLQQVGLFPQQVHADTSSYVALLGVLASLGGTFLALYFTTLGVVTSTRYARVPSEVRELVLREETGTLYVNLVALLPAVATLLLGAYAVGWRPGLLNLVAVGGLGLLSVFSFLMLARRLFQLFSPASLASAALKQLPSAILGVAPEGIGWRADGYQAQYQREAEDALSTYRSLVRLETSKESEDIQGPRVRELMDFLMQRLDDYAAGKARIPTKSRWFRSPCEWPPARHCSPTSCPTLSGSRGTCWPCWSKRWTPCAPTANSAPQRW